MASIDRGPNLVSELRSLRSRLSELERQRLGIAAVAIETARSAEWQTPALLSRPLGGARRSTAHKTVGIAPPTVRSAGRSVFRPNLTKGTVIR
jgi:hypothetical protein